MARKEAGSKSTPKYKSYTKLHKTYEYDRERAEVLAEAMTELIEIEKRKRYLEELLKENKDLKRFLWGTAEGEVIAIHKLDDEHISNILPFLHSRGRSISPELKAEARSRGILVDDEPSDKSFSYKIDSGLVEEDLNDEW